MYLVLTCNVFLLFLPSFFILLTDPYPLINGFLVCLEKSRIKDDLITVLLIKGYLCTGKVSGVNSTYRDEHM